MYLLKKPGLRICWSFKTAQRELFLFCNIEEKVTKS